MLALEAEPGVGMVHEHFRCRPQATRLVLVEAVLRCRGLTDDFVDHEGVSLLLDAPFRREAIPTPELRRGFTGIVALDVDLAVVLDTGGVWVINRVLGLDVCELLARLCEAEDRLSRHLLDALEARAQLVPSLFLRLAELAMRVLAHLERGDP